MGKLPFEEINRKVIVRLDEEPGKYGFYPDKRPMDYHLNYGMVNLDKPSGPTSHQVSSWARDVLGLKKAGHSGTLDPNVTGVLPIGLEKATKVLSYILKAGKEYVGLMRLHRDATGKQITRVMKGFVGDIRQKPPVKSNVKRVERTRTVYYLEILEIDGRNVLFRTGVQAGTYIRKLCDDIGKKLNTGAHMVELRRTKAGPFFEKDIVTLQDLTDAWYYFKNGDEKPIRKLVVPVERGVEHLAKVWVSNPAVSSIGHGARLAVPGIVRFHTEINKGDTVAIMSLKNELVAVGEAAMDSTGMKEKERGIAVETERVIIPNNLYKKMWRK
jgi:H/ACA ribonucleoprotein complex subunit 4